MTTFILTWNPTKWSHPPGELETAIETIQHGGVYNSDWSVG